MNRSVPLADPADRFPTGVQLSAYLLASRAIPAFATALLKRRLARGKEDALRWREKLGIPGAPRPEGRLIWLHAVGLGEVLALRALIAAMAGMQPDLSFLVTSSARSSGQVMGANLPPRTIHQFLPLDAPSFVTRFLDHWRPDLSVWAEQELWPGAVVETARRGIPLAMVNARMTQEGFARRTKIKSLYRDLLARFEVISAQDRRTADRLGLLGAAEVSVAGSLKSASPPLAVDADLLAQVRAHLAGRRIWVAASTHAEDEAEILAALPQVRDRLLILVPRDAGRAAAVAQRLQDHGLRYVQRSRGGMPTPETQVWLADTYGELGLWYRLAEVALIGGSFGQIGGHNPWEASALGVAVLHGPDTGQFVADYATLNEAGAARRLEKDGLAAALTSVDADAMGAAGKAVVERSKGSIRPLAARLLDLLEVRR